VAHIAGTAAIGQESWRQDPGRVPVSSEESHEYTQDSNVGTCQQRARSDCSQSFPRNKEVPNYTEIEVKGDYAAFTGGNGKEYNWKSIH
jgi:hypothetical protein